MSEKKPRIKKLPTSVTVLGKDFDISYTMDIDTNTYGETNVLERTIKINSNKDKKESTLLHEIIHAVLGVSGYSERMSEQEEEALVVLLENGLENLIELK